MSFLLVSIHLVKHFLVLWPCQFSLPWSGVPLRMIMTFNIPSMLFTNLSSWPDAPFIKSMQLLIPTHCTLSSRFACMQQTLSCFASTNNNAVSRLRHCKTRPTVWLQNESTLVQESLNTGTVPKKALWQFSFTKVLHLCCWTVISPQLVLVTSNEPTQAKQMQSAAVAHVI